MSLSSTQQTPRDPAAAGQFADLVELHVTTKGFLTHDAERTLLETGIRDFGLTLTDARGVLHASADRASVPVEREVERTLNQWLKAVGGKRRRVSREQFNQAAQVFGAQAQSELAPAEIRSRVKTLMEAQGLEPRRAGLFRSKRWYRKI
jgi:hypothetical protein